MYLATQSRVLLGESSNIEVPGGLQSIETQTVGHDWVTKHTRSCLNHHLKKEAQKWQIQYGTSNFVSVFKIFLIKKETLEAYQLILLFFQKQR